MEDYCTEVYPLFITILFYNSLHAHLCAGFQVVHETLILHHDLPDKGKL